MMGMEAVLEGMTDDARADDGAVGIDDWRRLFGEIADGRAAALDELYDLAGRELYGLALWRTGSSEDAADVVQEVFLRLVQRRGELAKVRDPRIWLLTVTRRIAIDTVRRRLARRSEPLESLPYLQAPVQDSDRRCEAERASELIASLPTKQREAVYLRHFAECSFAVMGRVLGVPTFTAASRYRLAIASLRRHMKVQP
jgi:RNA polymerase sigma factor (sigma-70 family)